MEDMPAFARAGVSAGNACARQARSALSAAAMEVEGREIGSRRGRRHACPSPAFCLFAAVAAMLLLLPRHNGMVGEQGFACRRTLLFCFLPASCYVLSVGKATMSSRRKAR